ncbi:DNA-binding domain-containing protein [Ferrovibrio sp.]|uniref:HvfC/BufC N-terminal domain-containing protein n=1 Tax=Ferrovibrio sp. TaxID=1917215 RepID=UPI003D278AA9
MSAALHALQASFADALLDPDAAAPAGLADRRFTIYRNNVQASLAAALEARFPVIRRLVGDEFCRALMLSFLRTAPPNGPVLARYGAGLADFLENFPPARELPYLADMARLEWARSEVYHAADASALRIDALAQLPQDKLPAARLLLHPALRLVVSAYPIVSLWHTNAHDAEVRPLSDTLAGEAALITRPHLEVLVTALPEGGAAFLAALLRGAAFAEAAEAAGPEADLPRLLATLFDAGAIAGIKP